MLLCWEVVVPPPGPFPTYFPLFPHGGSCPGDFRRELLRYVCQQRWRGLKACSSNTILKKKKKRKKVQALAYPKAVLFWIIICLVAVPRVPYRCVSPSQDSQNIQMMLDGVLPCEDNTAFQGKNMKICGVDPVLELSVTLSCPQPQGTAEGFSIYLAWANS